MSNQFSTGHQFCTKINGHHVEIRYPNEYIYVCFLSLPADDCQSALRMLPLGRLVSGSASAVAEFFRSHVMLPKPALKNNKQDGSV